jgi:phosphoribosyl 1,2-cyclic phosphate phosphodiesterase
MQVTLLGTGDTAGTPAVDCDCETCERARAEGVERTRFSVHVRNEATGECLLVDASPDFRRQFLERDVAPPDAAVVTHVHFDHLDGLGNLYRLVGYDEAVPVHAADGSDPGPAAVGDGAPGDPVATTVADRYDYLDAVAVSPEAPLEPFEAAGLECRLVPVDHPPLPCYGLVVEDPTTGGRLVLTGDTSYDVPDRSRAAMADPDLLLADAIVPADQCHLHPRGGRHEGPDGVPRTFGTKHMTREGALALADDLGAAETRLVHVAHFTPAEAAFAAPFAVDGESYTL